MRTFTLVLITFLSITAYGQNAQYLEAFKAGTQKIDSVKGKADWIVIANTFERIANAEPTKWEPLYYAAYCRIMNAFMEKGDAIDPMVDLADANIEKAELLQNNESEIYVLKAMALQARISASPMNRGKEYSEKAAIELLKAEKLNADNPRINFSRANSLFYTPKFFGGGPKAAKPLFEKAKLLFDKFVPKNETSPNWGKKYNGEMLKKCE